MTDINLTFSILNSYFLNTATMKINEDYLNHLINVHCFNTDRRIYDDMHNKRLKSYCLVWRGFVGMVNELFKYSAEYPNTATRTNYQLKKWLEKYGRGYDSIAQTVNDRETYRKEEIFCGD